MADTARAKRRLTGRASVVAILLIMAVAGVVAFFAGDRGQLSAAFLSVNYAKGIPSTAVSSGSRVPAASPAQGTAEPEALLARTLEAIKHSRMDHALVEVDKIIEAYPNFRLAHLIKGDLLLARARPISAMGNVSDAPQEALDDLRDEARAPDAPSQRTAARSGAAVSAANAARAAPRVGG